MSDRPAVGSEVELYPRSQGFWLTLGSAFAHNVHPAAGPYRYKIAEWRGNNAWMEDGSIFRWTPAEGFLL